MAPVLFLDLETDSPLDLKEVGGGRYAEDCTVLVGAVAVDDSAPALIQGDDDLLEVLHGAGTEFELVAHNAFFDLSVVRGCWPKSWLWLGTHAFVRDTMMMARALNLPGTLEGAHKALFPDLQGKLLDGKAQVRHGRDLLSDPGVLKDYVRQDVEMTRRVWKALSPRVAALDMALPAVDVKVNMRGFGLDTEVCVRRANEINTERGNLDTWARAHDFTQVLRRQDGGHLLGSKVKVNKHVEWLGHQGFKERERAADLLSKARRDWQLSAAESKWKAGERFVCSDGRAKGMLHARVAQSGRWVSRDLQVHNMKRATEDALLDTRAMVVADEGKTLVAADYSQMELRLGLWMARADEELAALKEGRDLYSEMAERALGREPGKDDRFAMKTMLLATLYGQGRTKTLGQMAEQGADPKVAERLWEELERGVRQRLKAAWRRLTQKLRDSTGMFCALEPGLPEVWKRAAWIRLPIWDRPLLWHGIHWAGDDTSYETWRGQWVRERIWGGTFFAHVVQGTASDLLAAALVKAEAELGGEARVVAHCHDEIVVECLESEAPTVAANLREWMVGAAKGIVPMAVETGVGKRWRDCK